MRVFHAALVLAMSGGARLLQTEQRGEVQLVPAARPHFARAVAPRRVARVEAAGATSVARALPRAARRQRRHRRASRSGDGPDPGQRGVHGVPSGSPEGTRVRELVRLQQPRKLLELYNHSADSRDVLPLVMRGLLKLRRLDLALDLYALSRSRADVSPSSACVLVLALCRDRSRLADAASLVADLGREYPVPPGATWEKPEEDGEAAEPMWHVRGAVMVPALASAYLAAGDVPNALRLARTLAAVPPALAPLTSLMRAFGKAQSLPGVYACLDAQLAGAREPDAEYRQVLVDALLRSSRFVKGGVSMDTLPQEALPEVAFVGRSNVGKSSLVNMVLGRRALSYTSKTPGKTQQYNYFIMNEGREGAFHLVDMPGLGYAKVPGAERAKWLAFLREYTAQRPQLRLLVHLIDGNVGVTETDRRLLAMVRDSRTAAGGRWDFAVVLTKTEKAAPKAVQRVAASVEAAAAEAGVGRLAVVATSAKSKFGRPEMWRLLRPVVLDERNSAA